MELVYEFDSVTDKYGKSKMNIEKHANPVFIIALLKGRPAMLSYVDKPELGLTTSKVEDIFIHNNNIKIETQNTVYWLKPYIRERFE